MNQIWHDLLLATYAIAGMFTSGLIIVRLYLRRRWKQVDDIEKRRRQAEDESHEKIRALEEEKSRLETERLASFGKRVEQLANMSDREALRMDRFDGRMDRFEVVTERHEKAMTAFMANFGPIADLIRKMAEAQLKQMHSTARTLPQGNVRISEKTVKKS